MYWNNLFKVFMGVSRDLRECSSPEVSCLLSRRYHIRWKNKPSFGLEYESSRQLSDGFHNPLSSDGVGWVAAVRAGENSACRQPPAPLWILSASSPQNERCLTKAITQRTRSGFPRFDAFSILMV
ncbi:uncharacterized protein ASPGLDRAFT_1012219 [Aspergillus glaucus CBS 516.65]|uniref:Uncharacterized protein n=1 Tax=Aspergillus glaucus CBS 516.65 TaxID=1160497 RepID=A0A1L9VVQ2_ASPGL|nr:hypothetical protein ASPGLDRAFT_1012219 [Aspergillus glaucus CBS 516.65]OJJ87981.1 hypothetical protein ASPGLDRAFT_1012219 [Aspergillus glaucus CBS 516.65]